MKKTAKTVRLTDREVKYVEKYRGENFSDSFSNIIYDMCEKQEQLVEQWNRTQAEINDRREELRRITEKVRLARVADARLQPLLDAVIALLEQA